MQLFSVTLILLSNTQGQNDPQMICECKNYSISDRAFHPFDNMYYNRVELSSTIALQHNNATDMVWLPYSVPKQTSFTSCCPRPHNKITHYFLTIFTGETDICPIKLSLVKTLFQKNKNSVDFERRIEHFKMTK